MFGRQRLKISCLSITRHTKHGLKLETRLGGSGFFETVPKASSFTKPGDLRCWSGLDSDLVALAMRLGLDRTGHIAAHPPTCPVKQSIDLLSTRSTYSPFVHVCIMASPIT
jgi:hypothetical protein